MKRSTLRILLCLVLALFLIPAALASAIQKPQLEADGSGSISGSGNEDSTLYLAAYDYGTGQFLGLQNSGDRLASLDVVFKAIQTDADSAPVSGTRSVLVIGRGGGTYSGGEYDQVVISSAVTGAVVLKDMVILGDLLACGGADVTLDGVEVYGELKAGEPDTASLMDAAAGGRPSIIIKNTSSVGSIRVSQTADGGLRVRAEEGCRVEWVYVDDGQGTISLEGEFNQVVVDTVTPVTLSEATVSGVTVKAKDAEVTLEKTQVTAVLIAKDAEGATVTAEENSRIARVDTRAEAAKITGEGTVIQAEVSGDGTSVDTVDTYLVIKAMADSIAAESITVTVNGKAVEVDSGSSDEYTTTAQGVMEPVHPEEHVHSWDDGVITRVPTETEDGVRTRVCTICGETNEQPIARLPFCIVLENGARKSFSTLEAAMGEAEQNVYSVTEDGVEWQYYPRIELRGDVSMDALELPAGHSLRVYGTLTVNSLNLHPNTEPVGGKARTYSRVIVAAPVGVLKLGEESWGYSESCHMQLLGQAPEDPDEFNGIFIAPDFYGEEIYTYFVTFGADVRINKNLGIYTCAFGNWDYGEKHTLTVASGAEVNLGDANVCMNILVEEGGVLNLSGMRVRGSTVTVSEGGRLAVYDGVEFTSRDGENSALVNNGTVDIIGQLFCEDCTLRNNKDIFVKAFVADEALEGEDEPRIYSGVLDLQRSALTNNGSLTVERTEDGEHCGLLRLGSSSLHNAASGSVTNGGNMDCNSGCSLVNAGVLTNLQSANINMYTGENRTVIYGNEEPVREDTAKANVFTSTGALINEGSSEGNGNIQLNGTAVYLAGTVENNGWFHLSAEEAATYTFTLEAAHRADGSEPWVDDPLFEGWLDFQEQQDYWRRVKEEWGESEIIPAGLTLSGGKLVNRGDMELIGADLTVASGATLENHWSLSLSTDRAAFEAPAVVVAGTLTVGGENENPDWIYNQRGGSLTVEETGKLVNWSNMRLYAGCALENKGSLTNYCSLNLDLGENRTVAYGEDDVRLEETGAACSFVSSGTLVNGDEAHGMDSDNQAWIRVTGKADFSGSVANYGGINVSAGTIQNRTVTLENLECGPEDEPWRDNENWWDWNWGQDYHYWSVLTDAWEDGDRVSGAFTVSGRLVNLGRLECCSAPLTVAAGAELLNGRDMDLGPTWEDLTADSSSAHSDFILNGSFTNAEGCGNYNQYQGSLTVGTTGVLANWNHMRLYGGGVVTNLGTLKNYGDLNLEPGENRSVTYGDREPQTEERAGAWTFVSSGSLVNGDRDHGMDSEYQPWIRITGTADFSGSVVNYGGINIREDAFRTRTVTLENLECGPEDEPWRDDENWWDWDWSQENRYWSIAGEQWTCGNLIPGALTVSGGAFTNLGRLEAASVPVTLKAGAELINEGNFDLWVWDGDEGEPAHSLPGFLVQGTFTNGSITGVGEEYNGSGADFWITQGSLRNEGRIVNNGNFSLDYVDYVQTETGSLTTYNTGGANFYSGSITVPSGGTFVNQGALRIFDRYGMENDLCDVSGFEDFFTTWQDTQNGSNWCEYVAQVYDAAGFRAAEEEQARRIAAWENREDDSALDTRYNRMDICGDITLDRDLTLENFGYYRVSTIGTDLWHRWNEETQEWEDCQPEDEGAESYWGSRGIVFTVSNGTTLTVARYNTLEVDGDDGQFTVFMPGRLVIEEGGRLVIEPRLHVQNENEDYVTEPGYVCIRAFGSFENYGTVEYAGESEDLDGIFEVRWHEHGAWNPDKGEWGDVDYDGTFFRPEQCPTVGLPEKVLWGAEVRSDAGLPAAVNWTEPTFGRLYIRCDHAVTVKENLTVNADINTEPGSGLLVEYGATLTLNGHFWNDADTSIYGDLVLCGSIDNNQYIEVGSFTDSEPGRILVYGYLENRGHATLKLYPSGKILLCPGGDVHDYSGNPVRVTVEGQPEEGREYWNCVFTEDVTLNGRDGEDTYYRFSECEFLGNVTVLWTENNGNISAEFFDNSVLAQGKKLLVTGDAEAARIDNESIDAPTVNLWGVRGLTIESENMSLNAGLWQAGSFTLNGIAVSGSDAPPAHFDGDPADWDDHTSLNASLRYEKWENDETHRVFQVDADAEWSNTLAVLSGSPEGFDELRLQQGRIDVSGVTLPEGAYIQVNNSFARTEVALGANSANVWLHFPGDENGFDPAKGYYPLSITADAGAEINLMDLWMVWYGDNYYSPMVSVNGCDFNAHIFGTREDNDEAGVFFPSADEGIQYFLSVGEGQNAQELEYERELNADENKTHLWRAGEESPWFTAGPDADPGLHLSVCLPTEEGDGVWVHITHVPVKPEWLEPAQAD